MPLDRETVLDDLARLIAGAVWNPQPDMSGDVWKTVSSTRRRICRDAALSALEYFETLTDGSKP